MVKRAEEVLWDDERLTAVHAQADKARRVRRMFDAIAPCYELVNTLASAGRDRHWRRAMVRLAKVQSDDVLLDVACGTGDVARTFAVGLGRVARPGRIIGVDFSAPMLARAMARPIAAGVFLQGDALRLPIADQSVSIVTCAFGIRNFQDLPAGLAEMYRVLRDQGRAIILEFSVPSRPVVRGLYLFYVTQLMPAIAALISRDRTGAYRYLPSSVLSFDRSEMIADHLRQVGFNEVTVHPRSGGIVSIYVAMKNASAPGTVSDPDR